MTRSSSSEEAKRVLPLGEEQGGPVFPLAHHRLIVCGRGVDLEVRGRDHVIQGTHQVELGDAVLAAGLGGRRR
jgi:hypothetical protein